MICFVTALIFILVTVERRAWDGLHRLAERELAEVHATHNNYAPRGGSAFGAALAGVFGY